MQALNNLTDWIVDTDEMKPEVIMLPYKNKHFLYVTVTNNVIFNDQTNFLLYQTTQQNDYNLN